MRPRLARAHSALGDYAVAADYVEKALDNVPEGDTLNRDNLEQQLEKLRQGQPMS